MRRRVLGVFFVTLSLGLVFRSHAAAPQGDVALTTVMRWSGQGSSPNDPAATFIPWLTPIALLNLPYANWPIEEKAKLPQSLYDKFWTMVQERIASGDNECALPPISFFADRTLVQQTQPVSVTDVVKSFPLVVIGTEVNNHPAWDYRLGRLATISYIRVDEVLKSGYKGALPTYLSIAREYGSVQVNGTILCTNGEVQFHKGSANRQVAGLQQVIVAGRLAKGNSGFVETSPELIFRVDNGDVLNPSMVPAYSAVPMSLATFRTQVQN